MKYERKPRTKYSFFSEGLRPSGGSGSGASVLSCATVNGPWGLRSIFDAAGSFATLTGQRSLPPHRTEGSVGVPCRPTRTAVVAATPVSEPMTLPVADLCAVLRFRLCGGRGVSGGFATARAYETSALSWLKA